MQQMGKTKVFPIDVLIDSRLLLPRNRPFSGPSRLERRLRYRLQPLTEPAMTLNERLDSLATLVTAWKNRRVLVLGDAIVDEYLLGDCSRISPEAPVPVLKVNRTQRVLGGA